MTAFAPGTATFHRLWTYERPQCAFRTPLVGLKMSVLEGLLYNETRPLVTEAQHLGDLSQKVPQPFCLTIGGRSCGIRDVKSFQLRASSSGGWTGRDPVGRLSRRAGAMFGRFKDWN